MKVYGEEDDKKLNNAVSDYIAGGLDSYDIIVYLTNNLIIKLIDDIIVDYNITQDIAKSVYEEIFANIKEYGESDSFLLKAEQLATDYAYKYVKENMEELLKADYQKGKGFKSVPESAAKDNEKIIPKDFPDDSDKQYFILGLYRQLPVLSKVVFQYYYIENVSVKDIAKKMECSQDVVRKRINYIKNLIRTALVTGQENDKQEGYSFSQMPVLQYIFREESELVLSEEYRTGTEIKAELNEDAADKSVIEADNSAEDEEERTASIVPRIIFFVIAAIVMVVLVVVLTKGIKNIKNRIFEDENVATATDATVSDATMTDPRELEAMEAIKKEMRYYYAGAVIDFCTPNVGNLPGETGQYDATEPEEFMNEKYAVHDVDKDGKEELLMWLSSEPSTKEKHYFGIYEYDLENDKWITQYAEHHTDSLKFYDNGTAILESTDYENIDGEWRASIYDFDMQSNSYNKKYDIFYKEGSDEDTYYVTDQSDKKLSDNLTGDEIANWVNEQIGKEIIPVYMDGDNLLEQNYRVAYVKMLWEKNEVIADGDITDIGEAYINSSGDVDTVARLLQNNRDVEFTNDTTGYLGEEKVINLDSGEDSVSIELVSYMDKVTVFGIQPGMNYDEAMAILESHGFYYYASYSQYSHQYAIGKCLGDYCVKMDFEDGVITTIGLGTIQELR